MKTIAFNRHPGEAFATPIDIDLIADSALVLPGRPLFVPDFSSSWMARIYLVFRVSRLGKSINRKFAHRYYDAVTLAVRLIPREPELPQGLAGLFDDCLQLGRWVKLPAEGEKFSIVINDNAPIELSLDEVGIESAVSLVSNVATIKMGDIILPCSLPQELGPVEIDSRLVATVGGEEALSVKFK